MEHAPPFQLSASLLVVRRFKLALAHMGGWGQLWASVTWMLSRTIQLYRSKDDATALFEVYGKSLGELLAFGIRLVSTERNHRTRSVGQQLVPCALSRSALCGCSVNAFDEHRSCFCLLNPRKPGLVLISACAISYGLSYVFLFPFSSETELNRAMTYYDSRYLMPIIPPHSAICTSAIAWGEKIARFRMVGLVAALSTIGVRNNCTQWSFWTFSRFSNLHRSALNNRYTIVSLPIHRCLTGMLPVKSFQKENTLVNCI